MEAGLHVDGNSRRRVWLGRNLRLLGISMYEASSAKEAIEMLKERRYRLVIVDFCTVGGCIFRLCSSIRSNNTQALVIVLMDQVKLGTEKRLFESGVDDVVVGKQLTAAVLTKRIEAHLRNIGPPRSNGRTIRVGNTVVDFDRREVWCNGSVRRLPGILADLLKYFFSNADHIISREELRQSPIWVDSICSPANEGGKTFDVNVSKLRKIVEPDPEHPQIIVSVRGVGWKLGKNFSYSPCGKSDNQTGDF